MSMTSFIRAGLAQGRTVWRSCAALALLVCSMTQSFALDSVEVTPLIPVAYEAGLLPASFTVTRSGSTGTITVNYVTTGSTATSGADFVALSGSVTFVQGESSKTITVTPVQDVFVEGRELVLVSISPNPSYIVGASPSAQISIADNDLVATLQIPDAGADEDVTLFGFATDPEVRRRGVTRINFTNSEAIAKDLTVQFSGTAQLTADYTMFYKISGSDPTLPNTGANSSVSHIATNTLAGNFTTGEGYITYAYLIGDGTAVVPLSIGAGSGAVSPGNSISFSDNPTQTYVVATSTVGLSAGTITVVGGLLHNLTNGSVMNVLSGATPPTGFLVNNSYGIGTQTLRLADGIGGIYRGDVFTIAGDTNIYVATSDLTDRRTGVAPFPLSVSGGYLDFTRHISFTAPSPGIGVVIAAGAAVTTKFPTSATLNHILVPRFSRKVEFAVEPIADGVIEGVESAVMTMFASEDYAITNPTVGTVLIADRDITVDVALGANAGKPSTGGSFLVTLKDSFGAPAAFPVPVTVPYTVDVSSTAVPGTDYVALSGSITIPAGQTSASIAVTPLNTLPVGLRTVTIILNATLSYALAGSSSSSSNPSATVNITDSLGTVGITATTPTTTETPGTPVNGRFTFTLPAASRTGAGDISVNYTISGTAAISTRYSLTPVNATVLTGVVTIIDDGNAATDDTATLDVVPIDNLIAEGSEVVSVTLASGQGYGINATASTAQVTIIDNEPQVSVVKITDASRPGTPGSFRISFPGPALTQALNVNYTFSGTAISGTDFNSAPVATATILAGNLFTDVVINPTNITTSLDVISTITISPSTAYTIAGASDSLTIFALSDVGIVATTPTAMENFVLPVPAASRGVFTVTVNRTASALGAIIVNYTVAGATGRFTPLTGTVTIPAFPVNTAQIAIEPIDNQVVDGSEDVIVTLVVGAGYSFDAAAASATVTIQDDEPVVSVVADFDAARPATPGQFTISYPGTIYPGSGTAVALNRAVTVPYSFLGTAVPVVDFSDSALPAVITGSVTIPANSRSATVTITPTNIAATTDMTVIMTVATSPSYTVGTANDTVLITHVASAGGTKPTPGTVASSSSSSGCGSGSGFAILLGVVFLALHAGLAGYRSKDAAGR